MTALKFRPLFVMSAVASGAVVAIEVARLMSGGRGLDEVTLTTALLLLVGSIAVLNSQFVKAPPRG